jgi:conjugative relaxase-like TrwC/TraI family protein
VLSRGKVTPAAVSYYTDEVAKGIEDYYAGRGEAKGVWVGAGSAHERLRGEVEAEELARLFEGRHPRTGDSLGASYRVGPWRDVVTGWDLTFSAPKSVSVLWAVGGGDVGMEVRDAHDAAVTAALRYLEEHAAFSRTGKAGVRQVDTHGFLAAAFVHRTSRAGDPQLHTHVLVSGRVRCDDGVWRALDSRALHRQLKPAGMVYQAALRAELTMRLGVEWAAVDRNGQAEIVGVPPALRRLFAQRRASVEARAAERIAELEASLERHLTPAERRRAFERAVLDTRDAKDHHGETTEGLHDRWQREAVAVGLAPVSWIGDTVDRHPRAVTLERDAVVEEIVAQLARDRSTWRRADVTREAARRAPTGAGSAEDTRAWIEATTDRVLAHTAVIGLRPPEPSPPAELLRRDGQSVFDRHDNTRYTTLATLEVEQRVVDLADCGRNAGRAIAEPDAVERAVRDHDLDDDQAEVVRAVTEHGDTVACVVGPAGTGKSRAMRAAAAAWQDSGIPVRGLAVSAVAAGVLSQEAQVPAETIAKFLFENDRAADPHSPWRLRPGEVVLVDEAGMVATGDLARLAQLVDRAGGKLVLVGDHAQLGAIEAGGLFRHLAEAHAVELGGVRRFSAAWEAAASLRLRARDPGVAAVYEEHGRVVASDRLGVVDTAATAWLRARAAGESIVITAADNPTVSAICDTIRQARVAAGDVEAGGVRAAGHIVGVGDQIVTLRNDRTLTTTSGRWVRNGDRWAITARHADGSLAVSHLDGHGRTTLPADYVADHVHLAYALTTHKAQGLTVDRAVAVVDETTTAEGLYVAMTRGRHDNTALVCVDAVDHDHHDPPRDPTDVLAAAISRRSAEQAALAALRDTLAASESLAVLAPKLASLDAQIQRETPDNPEPELARLAARRTYLERHQPSRLTRAGRDLRRTVRDLDDRAAELEAARAQRDQWLDDHADLFAYRDDLAQQVKARRDALGLASLLNPPQRLVDLVGPVPDTEPERQRWATLAGRVEAYREQWSVAPDDLRQPPVDGAQYREWNTAVHSLEIAERLDRLALERSIDRGIDRGIGIEL